MSESNNRTTVFTRANLLHLIIAKSVAEALLVTVVGIALYLVVTNTDLRGWLDQADAATISGWVVDERSAGSRVEVQLFIDDKFVEDRLASEFRPDVHQAQRANDNWHGFIFKTPPLAPGQHEARVFAVHRGGSGDRRTLQMIGKPIQFRVEAIGK
ncbi:MAG TPA: hypothetical protein VJT71_04570 [Pyrinomonadaceae bacterium]|nr:hypothetical protein [Pyrinomonadaceae bacterium]